MMNEAPVVPVEAPEKGPGLDVQVPATPVTRPVPAAEEDISVPPTDIEVPMKPVARSARPIESLDRAHFLKAIERMTAHFAERVDKRASAEARLAAFEALYPTLKGYALTQTGDMLDQVDQGDALDRSAKAYDTMVWNGASAQTRLGHLVHDLEGSLVPALPDRAWDMRDQRDRRYKVWLDAALAKGSRLKTQGASGQARLMYWGNVVKTALEFEQMPKEEFELRVASSAVVNSPVKAKVSVKPAVAEPKQRATERPTRSAEETTLSPTLGDGEWLYKVKPGDTLLSLANRYYGDYNRWRDIYKLNQDRLGRGGNLRPGQLLVMPKKKGR
jgi:hypothetical protein